MANFCPTLFSRVIPQEFSQFGQNSTVSADRVETPL